MRTQLPAIEYNVCYRLIIFISYNSSCQISFNCVGTYIEVTINVVTLKDKVLKICIRFLWSSIWKLDCSSLQIPALIICDTQLNSGFEQWTCVTRHGYNSWCANTSWADNYRSKARSLFAHTGNRSEAALYSNLSAMRRLIQLLHYGVCYRVFPKNNQMTL